jgi:hypothetical protein
MKEDYIFLYAKLENAFNPEIKRVIDSGIQATFNFIIELREKSALFFWLDKKIKQIKIAHRVFYNILEKKYILELKEKKEKFIFTSDFKKAQHLVERIEKVKVIHINQLSSKKFYYLRIRVEVNSIELYPPLNLIFNVFTPYWNFKTKWQSSSLFRGFK